MRIAGDAGLEVVERLIDRSELYLADEVFSGTGVQVAPVSSIDGRLGHRRVSDLARHPATLLRRRPRQRSALSALAHPDLEPVGTRPQRGQETHWYDPLEPRHQSRHAGRRQHRALDCHERERARQPRPLVLHGGDHRWRAHAEGNGAIDALMKAVDVALAPCSATAWPWTYDVHASGPGHDSAASGQAIRPAPTRTGPSIPACRQRERARGLSRRLRRRDQRAPRRHRRGRGFRRPITSGETNTHETDPDHTTHGKDRIMSAYNH